MRILHLTKQTGWFSLLLWLMAIAPAPAHQLRVAITSSSSLNLATSTPGIISDERGQKLGDLQPLQAVVANINNDRIAVAQTQVTQLWVKPQSGGYVWIGDRWYRGSVKVIATKKQLLAVNHIDLEQYLYSVLGSEMSPTFPAEALKAQAVAARTYALYRSQSTSKKPFDVDNTQASQVYRGLSGESNTTQAAVNATLGKLSLTRANQSSPSFMHLLGGIQRTLKIFGPIEYHICGAFQITIWDRLDMNGLNHLPPRNSVKLSKSSRFARSHPIAPRNLAAY